MISVQIWCDLIWTSFASLFLGCVSADTPFFTQIFQDPATSFAFGLFNLHHDICTFLGFISGFVGFILAYILITFDMKRNIHPPIDIRHNAPFEIVWTAVPLVILFFIAFPSFVLLYALEEVTSPLFTIKVSGSQWFWDYEYSDLTYFFSKDGISDFTAFSFKFSSNLVQDADVYADPFRMIRLLSVDNFMVVPEKIQTRLIITANDVLHCWTVPSFGIKVDACPGRLNQVFLLAKRVGMFYGQCSEICGINHGFMPIQVLISTPSKFIDWLYTIIK